MKYNPDLINKYPGMWKNRKTFKRYCALTKLHLGLSGEPHYYYCTICNKHFKTSVGADNHLRVKHEKEILNTIK